MMFALAVSGLIALTLDLPQPKMDVGGWTFMGLAWISVTFLLVWSFIRVLSGPKDEPKSDAS